MKSLLKKIPGLRNFKKKSEAKSSVKGAPGYQETIALNSLVEVCHLDSKEKLSIKIVLPDAVDLKNRWISVFAPLSAALIGRRKGEVVKWNMGGVEREVKVIDVMN